MRGGEGEEGEMKLIIMKTVGEIIVLSGGGSDGGGEGASFRPARH